MTEVPNRKGIKVKLPSGTVAVFRQGERMFVMSNSCPHAGFDLSCTPRICLIYEFNGLQWETLRTLKVILVFPARSICLSLT